MVEFGMVMRLIICFFRKVFISYLTQDFIELIISKVPVKSLDCELSSKFF